MTTKQEIDRNVKFLGELRVFLGQRVKDPEMAHGAVCALVLEAAQICFILNENDPAGTRDMMVSALNLTLKHGLKNYSKT